MRVPKSLGMVLVLLAAPSIGCKRSPDRDVLPWDQDSWCCQEAHCFASKQIEGFPECTNVFWQGDRSWGITGHGHDVAGRFVTCDITLRKALAIDPDVLNKTEIDARLPNTDAGLSDVVRSCLNSVERNHKAMKAQAYVFTHFDKRDEKKNFGAYPSKYYCDQSRNELKKADWADNVSDCEKVAAVR